MHLDDLLAPELKAKLDEQTERLNGVPFSVLIWGPGAADTPQYRKRVLIREHLSDKFGADNVYFSEDGAFDDYGESLGIATAEAIQAEAVDAIIVLDTGPGPHTEILMYGDIIAMKALVFMPIEYSRSRSFAAEAYTLLRTFGYTEDEFQDCDVVRWKAHQFAGALRRRKAREAGVFAN